MFQESCINEGMRSSRVQSSGMFFGENGNTVYLDDWDVFDEFENRFNDFLKSTPYIEQILQTSKEYRMIIDSLNILAKFNDELKRICTMTSSLAEKGKKLYVSK
mmetsp:Transcript_14516/g.14124  ORF Transcript_14516/g.14124 Transcript_14516/m.14124 type:complete len:104 (-) Transcript_14516:202-513(-)|eukprot:CAMPEP_0170566742 /NCGR_PEP_ID=MMETSP0211-20121228/80033_1 /TAXON_ID=311385 /ORGANISM="Pseudokeronopsis sp., Strain OXSARD2" /LENGTH=103 /DNA_ID=CAMNT_0010888001 /DNA_START=1076 /DNA_END=1387 /DNA_ORIENTATION=+